MRRVRLCGAHPPSDAVRTRQCMVATITTTIGDPSEAMDPGVRARAGIQPVPRDRDRPARVLRPKDAACRRPASLADQARVVAIAAIDLEDTRFQFRILPADDALTDSIRAEGQQVPITLWGPPPYRILDGFRRLQALVRLGRETVVAVVRDDLDESGAFATSFIENVERRSFTTLDKAHAIWKVTMLARFPKEVVAERLRLSLRQVNRYLALFEFGEELRTALLSGRISMAHAALLQQARCEPAHWIEEIEKEGLSAPLLKKRLERLRKAAGRRGRPRAYLKRDGRGFRLETFRYHPWLDAQEKERILRALTEALAFVRQTTA
jgi:ParB/RepB/Spo0J family partition protein